VLLLYTPVAYKGLGLSPGPLAFYLACKPIAIIAYHSVLFPKSRFLVCARLLFRVLQSLLATIWAAL
jgi:hypothetical protein